MTNIKKLPLAAMLAMARPAPQGQARGMMLGNYLAPSLASLRLTVGFLGKETESGS
jgi:hypothetical protein